MAFGRPGSMYPIMNSVKTLRPIWMLVTACTIPMGIIQTKLITTAMSRAHQVRPVGQMYEVAKLSARQGTKMHRNHH